MTGDSDWVTDEGLNLELLTLPATTLSRVPQPAVRDAIRYFSPAVITISGERSPTAYATARDAAPNLPILHPQLGDDTGRVHHYRYTPDVGAHETSDDDPTPETIDILAVQTGDVHTQLQTQLASGERQTGPEAATFLFVPKLTVDWDTRLSQQLFHTPISWQQSQLPYLNQ